MSNGAPKVRLIRDQSDSTTTPPRSVATGASTGASTASSSSSSAVKKLDLSEASRAKEGEEAAEEEEEELEPQLKYQRVGGSVSEILKRDSASCIAVHTRFVALGTHSGLVHVLDFNGNEIKRFAKHTATINAISVEPSGEWLGSAADDGRVVVSSLYSDECVVVAYSRPVLALQLDPDYAAKTARPFCCGGREGKLLLNSKGFFRAKDTVVHSGEGSIYTIVWRGKLIAWANDVGVKVYDTDTSQRITYIARPRRSPRADLYRCTLMWLADDSLLIGWADNVQLARVKLRAPAATSLTASSVTAITGGADAGLPQKYMEIVVNFETDFWICGLAPFKSYLIALAYIDDDEEQQAASADGTVGAATAAPAAPASAGGNLRPELRVLSLANAEHSSDALTLNGFEQYRAADYQLVHLPADGQTATCDVAAMLAAGGEIDAAAVREAVADDDTLFYVLAPKDLVVARPRDLDDHITWLLDLGKYEEALLAVDETRLQRHTLAAVGAQYVEHLLRSGDIEAAAAICPKIVRDDGAQWEVWIVRFARLKRLDAIARYVPLRQPVLKDYVYELILNDFLNNDPGKFLETVTAWPPSLYKVQNIITAVREKLKKDSNEQLMDALAKLFTYNGEYDNTLLIYLRLKRGDAFGLIAERQLHDKVRDKVRLLCEFDEERAIALLVDSVEQIPIAVVVEQLTALPRSLHHYLHALFVRDPHAGRDYHEQQIALYADFAPALLLPFLRQSTYYRLERAYATCVERKLYREQVFILGRMGDTKKALALIMEQLGDVKQAIDFVAEHSATMQGGADAEDDELWEQLIKHALKSPAHIGQLLEHVGGRVDPLRLIRRVPNGMSIDGLRDRVVKIIADYSLQCRLREGCNQILKNDCVSLFGKLYAARTGGVSIDPHGTRCSVCTLSISAKPGVRNAAGDGKEAPPPAKQPAAAAAAAADGAKDKAAAPAGASDDDVIAFKCSHFGHRLCVAQQLDANATTRLFCPICKSLRDQRRRRK